MANTKISALTTKDTPVAADITNILDSAASNADKKILLSNIPLTGNIELKALGTGILKNTTTTGTPSIAVADTDYAPPLTAVYTIGKSANCATIAAAVAEIGSDVATMIVPSGTHDVAGNTTIPATTHMVCYRGANLKPASGVTLTLNCQLTAGDYQIFDTSAGGTIAGALSVDQVNVLWFGTTAAALNAAAVLARTSSGYTVYAPSGSSFLVSSTVDFTAVNVNFPRSASIRGQAGTNGTATVQVGGASVRLIKFGSIIKDGDTYTAGTIGVQASNLRDICTVDIDYISLHTKGFVVDDGNGEFSVCARIRVGKFSECLTELSIEPTGTGWANECYFGPSCEFDSGQASHVTAINISGTSNGWVFDKPSFETDFGINGPTFNGSSVLNHVVRSARFENNESTSVDKIASFANGTCGNTITIKYFSSSSSYNRVPMVVYDSSSACYNNRVYLDDQPYLTLLNPVPNINGNMYCDGTNLHLPGYQFYTSATGVPVRVLAVSNFANVGRNGFYMGYTYGFGGRVTFDGEYYGARAVLRALVIEMNNVYVAWPSGGYVLFKPYDTSGALLSYTDTYHVMGRNIVWDSGKSAYYTSGDPSGMVFFNASVAYVEVSIYGPAYLNKFCRIYSANNLARWSMSYTDVTTAPEGVGYYLSPNYPAGVQDFKEGTFVGNSTATQSGINPGWKLVKRVDTTLSEALTSGGSPVVTSAAGMAIGDLFLCDTVLGDANYGKQAVGVITNIVTNTLTVTWSVAAGCVDDAPCFSARWVAVGEEATPVAKTADYTVLPVDMGKRFNNTGATGTVTFTLPTAVVGYKVSFTSTDADDIHVDPSGSETILGGGAGKYLIIADIGTSVTLVCKTTSEWVIEASYGTLTFEG